ncbi:unnamed protein product [Lactuca virosa]|uniref:Helitron helicase-like domain-containing protein n=1 Tax=Lactuca virosa TaxID=75947 RepID=A0AAU9LFS1_9ASTR|nr:unnamed protein product [Lactuca virosa]
MRRRFLDAMALVQDDGRHDIFLTMTCNPKWKEIDDELLPGQSAQDRPDLVARVFHAKLEDLKVQLFQRHIIGVVGSYVYVIEFQKRGLPHAHFLLIMTPGYKMNNPDDYDKLVCSEIPDPIRWVAPYNPKLLMMFNCHINVEVCSSINSVKYLFKYVYKGHDKQVIHIDKDQENIVINDIQKFQDAHYVSPPEALWRVFSFPLSQIHPCVMALQIHLPNQQLARFKDGDRMEDIVDREKGKNSMLTTFFEKNKEDSNARKYLYKDFPKHFTWNRSKHCWRTRLHKSMIGRLVYANPAEGEILPTPAFMSYYWAYLL